MDTKKKFSEYTANQTEARSHEEAISEVQREIDVRRRLYDRWMDEGKLSRIDAHDRLERLLAALQFLIGEREMPAGGF